MEFRNLLSFLRAAELGNFTQAAQELGYVQSAITTHIQQLEAEIGVPLFERIGRKNILTPYGQQLLTYANQAMQLEENILSIKQHDPSDIQGTIRIGSVESIMSSLLLDVIQRYRMRYPKVDVKIRLAITEPLFDMLRHNSVDVIFTIGSQLDTLDCVRVYSHPEEAVFIAAPHHPLSKRSSIPVEEILEYPIIVTGENSFLQQKLNELALQYGIHPDYPIQAESSRLIIDLIRQNLGISFLPLYMVRRTVLKDTVRILPVVGYSLPFFTNVFYHKNKWITPQMQGLLDLVKWQWEENDVLGSGGPDDI